jgi:PhzF family phenazine biosynthesis protein
LFAGNPAGVIIRDSWWDDQRMQCVAAENNLSETAFVVQAEDRCFDIRWFSPLCEIAFCGHATLATAFVLFRRDSGLNKVVFRAPAVGQLPVSRGDDGAMTMSFPADRPVQLNTIPDDLIAGLSIPPLEVWRCKQAYIAVYGCEKEVRELSQHAASIKKLAPLDVAVTAPGTAPGSHYDFVSRYFWPANGGDEDPVTGSIHTALAPLWAAKLKRSQLRAYQASARGGVLDCDVGADRVQLTAKAVHYMAGSIAL